MFGPGVNSTISHTYDLLGRLVGREIGSATIAMAYDALGRLISTTNPLGVLDFSYEDASNRLLTVSGSGHPLETHFSYFGAQQDRRLQTMEYVDAQEVVAQGDEYEYKPSGEISRWEQIRATGGAREWELHYDAISQLTEGTRRELTSGNEKLRDGGNLSDYDKLNLIEAVATCGAPGAGPAAAQLLEILQ